MNQVVQSVHDKIDKDNSKFDDLQETYVLFTRIPKLDMAEIPDPKNESNLHNNITQKLQIFANKHFETEQDDSNP